MIRHESQRGWFAYELFNQMKVHNDIWLLVGDLGYRMFDEHFTKYPYRCINTGAAEIALLDIAVGLALSGKKPFVYSITPFLISRGHEVIRNYINHEEIPVRMVASGRGNDYKHDGFSHYAGDDEEILRPFKKITKYRPADKKEIPQIVEKMVNQNVPIYLNLRRE